MVGFIVIIVMSGGRVKIPCHLLAYAYSYKILNFSGEGGGSRTFVRKIISPKYSIYSIDKDYCLTIFFSFL